jgi:hypothetical protein
MKWCSTPQADNFEIEEANVANMEIRMTVYMRYKIRPLKYHVIASSTTGATAYVDTITTTVTHTLSGVKATG